jgi:hypothetical protein
MRANVSLASVFDQAHECRKLLAQRIDPLEHDRQEKAKAALSRSFQEMAEDYVRFRSREIAAHTAYSWRTGLQRHVYPKIGRVPVNNIGTIEANSVLLPMCRETPVMAEKMRFLGKKILEHAVANNCRLPQPNPFEFKGNLEHNAGWVSRRDHVTKHCPALPWQQIGVFMEDLRL